MLAKIFAVTKTMEESISIMYRIEEVENRKKITWKKS